MYAGSIGSHDYYVTHDEAGERGVVCEREKEGKRELIVSQCVQTVS